MNSLSRRQLLQLVASIGLVSTVDRVLAADGRVGVRSLSGKLHINGRQAGHRATIKAGDTVATSPGSSVTYVIGKDVYLQRERTTVEFAQPSAQNFLRVITGKLLAVFGPHSDVRIVSTPSATIGIRGSGFYIEAGSGQPTYYCLCYGDSTVTPQNGLDAQDIHSKHHNRPVLIGTDKTSPIIDMPMGWMANHNDDELQLLEGLVGRKPPFAS